VRLVGIEVAERELRVAWGERRLGAVRLTAVERVPLDGGPEALRPALAALAAAGPAAVLTTLPLARTTHRLLTLPFRDRARLAGTAPLELLGQLPLSADDAVVATRPLGPTAAGSEVLAVAVPRAALDAHAASFADAGLPATRIDLAPLPALHLLPDGDGALVLADGGASALVLRRAGRVAGLRALGAGPADPGALATEVRWALRALGGTARIVLAGPDATRVQPALSAAAGATVDVVVAPATPTGAGSAEDATACAVAVGLVLGEGRGGGAGITLAGDGPDAPGRWRRPAALAAVALLLGVVDTALVRTALVRREAALGRAAAQLAAAALPGTPVRAARAQLEEAVAARRRLRPAGDVPVLEVLRELSARVPETLRLDLDELVIEPDAIRLHGRGQSFDAVEALRAALAASPLVSEVQADDTRTTVDGTGVEFRLRAVRRAALGAPS
jgi:type II secretion system protein L